MSYCYETAPLSCIGYKYKQVISNLIFSLTSQSSAVNPYSLVFLRAASLIISFLHRNGKTGTLTVHCPLWCFTVHSLHREANAGEYKLILKTYSCWDQKKSALWKVTYTSSLNFKPVPIMFCYKQYNHNLCSMWRINFHLRCVGRYYLHLVKNGSIWSSSWEGK